MESKRSFSIHLQGGFYREERAVVKVDGRTVYEGRPATMGGKGIAERIELSADSERIKLQFIMPDIKVKLSKTIDLNKGKIIGISIFKKKVNIGQRDSFGYK